MKRRRRRQRRRRGRVPAQAVLSAYACGLLAAIGLDPKGVLLGLALSESMIYVQALSWLVLLAIAILSYSSMIDYLTRANRAYRDRGAFGVIAVFAGIAAGFELLVSWRASAMLLVVALAIWTLAKRL